MGWNSEPQRVRRKVQNLLDHQFRKLFIALVVFEQQAVANPKVDLGKELPSHILVFRPPAIWQASNVLQTVAAVNEGALGELHVTTGHLQPLPKDPDKGQRRAEVEPEAGAVAIGQE